jgi:antitoxin component of MazEF toxin-antitoxin module
MKVQVQKWGNSLALRIPKSCAVESSIEQGTLVDVSVVNGKLVVAPATDKKYCLARTRIVQGSLRQLYRLTSFNRRAQKVTQETSN